MSKILEEHECDQAHAEISTAFQVAAKELGARAHIQFVTFGPRAQAELWMRLNYKKLQWEMARHLVTALMMGQIISVWVCAVFDLVGPLKVQAGAIAILLIAHFAICWKIARIKVVTQKELTAAAAALISGFKVEVEEHEDRTTLHFWPKS